MASENVPPFDRELETENVGYRWRTWIERFKIYLITIDTEPINDPADDQQPTDEYRKNQKKIIALLLHHMGPKTYNIYNTIKTDTDTFNQIITKMSSHFNPNENMRFSRTVFRQIKQHSGEATESFVSRLREAAVGCEFTSVDEEIITQVSVHGSSNALKKQILITSNLTLPNLLKMARMLETVDQSMSNESVNQIVSRPQSSKQTYTNNQHSNNKRHVTFLNRPTTIQSQASSSTCGLCGFEYPHVNRKCPASGKTCNTCGKLNHFSTVCRSKTQQKHQNKYSRTKQVNQLDTEETEEGESYQLDDIENDHIFSVESTKSRKKFIMLKLVENDVKFLIDTGTTINIIDENVLNQLDKSKIKINSVANNIYGYGSNKPLTVIGKFLTKIIHKNISVETEFVICSGSYGCILGLETLEALEIIKITCNNSTQNTSVDLARYPNLFTDDVGKIKGIEIKLHIDESVKPIQLPHRRIPFHLREKVEKEIDRMLKLDIIEPINGPTPWVSPIVVVPKPGQPDKIRICTDAKLANEAIQRERHITPTLDDLIIDLNGANHISKFDLNGGYHQLELHPDSRYITVFSTHIGLFQYKRLNFGINCAAEIFQNEIRKLIAPITGVKNVSDDMLVHGKTKEEHDQRVIKLLDLLDSVGATLNVRKVVIDAPEVEFYGLVFSGKGIKPSKNKIDAIKNAKPPKTPTEVRSLLGLAQFISRFIPNFATITEPLWNLTKISTKWHWNDKHDKAFNTLKEAISNNTLSYFNQDWDTILVVDASPVGLAAILIQSNPMNPAEQNILAYASRLLTEVEKRYSQVEKEALVCVWGCEKNHLYLFGKPFIIETDNKAVELIFRNPRSNPPARIQRWNLRLSQYNFKIRHRPGKDNPADYLSRNPAEPPISISPAEEYINFIEEAMTPKAIKIEDLVRETKLDITLQNVVKMINRVKYVESEDTKIFKTLINQLSVSTSGLIIKDRQLVIPDKLQECVIKTAHEGHLGIAKTKALLREHVWFPNLNKKVEEFVIKCLACQATVKQDERQEIHHSELPPEPWNYIALDFFGPICNIYLLLIICLYSRFLVVEKVNSTAHTSVIPKLNHLFSILGLPEKVKSDNGPPFNGFQFANFLDYMGIKHVKITPEWPKANGLAERFMQSLAKIFQTAKIESKKWEWEVECLVKSHNSAPHTTTGLVPSDLMFKFRARATRLPKNPFLFNKDDLNLMCERNHLKAKEKAQERNTHKDKELNKNDLALVKQKQTNKQTSYYDPNPYRIIEKKGTMCTAYDATNNHTITRNSSHFKKINPGILKNNIKTQQLSSSLGDALITEALHNLVHVQTSTNLPYSPPISITTPISATISNSNPGVITHHMLDPDNHNQSVVNLNETRDNYDTADESGNLSDGELNQTLNPESEHSAQSTVQQQMRRSTRTKTPVDHFNINTNNLKSYDK